MRVTSSHRERTSPQHSACSGHALQCASRREKRAWLTAHLMNSMLGGRSEQERREILATLNGLEPVDDAQVSERDDSEESVDSDESESGASDSEDEDEEYY